MSRAATRGFGRGLRRCRFLPSTSAEPSTNLTTISCLRHRSARHYWGVLRPFRIPGLLANGVIGSGSPSKQHRRRTGGSLEAAGKPQSRSGFSPGSRPPPGLLAPFGPSAFSVPARSGFPDPAGRRPHSHPEPEDPGPGDADPAGENEFPLRHDLWRAPAEAYE